MVMQLKTFLLGVVVLVMAASSASALFIPPHPIVSPTPEPVVYDFIDLDFSVVKSGDGVDVSGWQTSGNPVSPLAAWSWQFSNGKQVTGITGASAHKSLSPGKYTISLTVSDPLTMLNGKVVKRGINV